MSATIRAIAFLVGALAALGQSALTGGLQGTIRDAQGAAVANASVSISSESLSYKASQHSDALGNYRLLRLAPAADYVIEVTATLLEPWVRRALIIASGDLTTLDVTLAVKTQRTEIQVEADAAGLTSESTELSTGVSARDLNNLPSNGRNFVRFATLDPRVRNSSALGADGFAQNRLSINGSTFRNTQWRLDGNTNYDTLFNNSPLQRLSLSSIQEFRVLTNQFNAEHGSTSVGLVITTTRSGSDDLHGEGFFYVRPSGIQSRPPLAQLRIPNQLVQEGGSLGGPIRKGSTYFFANYERIDQSRGSFINSPAPDFFIGRFKDNLALAKLDHHFNGNHWLSARVSGARDANGNPNDAVGGLVQTSAARSGLGQALSSQVTDNTIWGSVVNELRVGYINAIPSNTVPALAQTVVQRPGYSTEGYSSFSTARTEVFQLADQISWQHRTHTLKAGGDFIRRIVRDTQFDLAGTYTFAGGPPVAGVGPTLYTQRFGTARLRYGQTQWAGFLQDTWRISSRLTVNLGLRYDYQSLLDDYNNLGPRAGFAWDLAGDQKTVVRGGYGLYYDQPFFHGLTQKFLLNGLTSPFAGYSISSSSPAFPVYPDSYPNDAPPPGLTRAPRNVALRNGTLLSPYTQQWTLGVQRALPWGLVLTMDAIRSLSVKQFLEYDINAASPFPRNAPGQMRTVAEADRTRPFYNPALGVSIYQGVAVREVRVNTNGNTATYHALDVSVARRFTNRVEMKLHYVYSSAIDSITHDHLGANPQEWSDVQRGERAMSDFSQRNRFVGTGLVLLPWQIQASAYVILASALAVNSITGVDNNGDTNLVDRPAGFGRNAFRGRPHRNCDLSFMRPLRISEKARLEIRADIFNVFNNQNYYSYNRVYGNGAAPLPAFLQPVAGISNTDPARQFTFGAKLLF